MTIIRRILFIALACALLGPASPLRAAPRYSWDGTWTGLWDGQYDTSITIVNNKVVNYTYRQHVVSIGGTKATPTTLSFGREFTVTLTRTGETTASAKYHGANGDASADLTRQ